MKIIKICGITNREDAVAAAEAGATAIGFNFYPGSKRYVDPEAMVETAAAVPEGVLKCGVFVNESVRRIEEIARKLGLEVAQLHGDEEPGEALDGIRIWKAYRVGAGFELPEFAGAEAYVLDGPAGAEFGGSGKTFAWESAAGLKQRIVLAGGLDGGNVGRAIAAARPWGVDACSRLESSPGKKDPAKMREFVQAAKAAEGWK